MYEGITSYFKLHQDTQYGHNTHHDKTPPNLPWQNSNTQKTVISYICRSVQTRKQWKEQTCGRNER